MTLMKSFLYSAAILGLFSPVIAGQDVQGASTTSTATTAQTATTTTSTYTQAEQNQIQSIISLYKSLDRSEYNSQTIYASPYNSAGYPFRIGTIKSNYIKATTQWLNYYRQLVGLPKVNTTNDQNYLSQLGASVLAGVNANPMLTQHGLVNSKQPGFISNYIWQQAQLVTNSSNLYFKANGETAGMTVQSLIADNTNIDGNDTGHRAWIFSPYLKTFGIGAAYGTNGWKYADMMVMDTNFTSYATGTPQKTAVTYPSSGVFPLQELTTTQANNHSVPWSIYFTGYQSLKGSLYATIKDDTTNHQITASGMMNASINQYGNYRSIFTFSPTGLALISGHQYTVTLHGLKNYPNGYTYSLKLFDLPDIDSSSQSALQQIDVTEKGVGTIRHATNGKAQVLSAPINGTVLSKTLANNTAWKTWGKTFINGQYYYNVGKNEWVSGRSLELSDRWVKGVVSIDYAPNKSIVAYNTPYQDQKPTGRYFKTGTAWKYHEVVNIGGYSWYNLGNNQWVPSSYVKVSK